MGMRVLPLADIVGDQACQELRDGQQAGIGVSRPAIRTLRLLDGIGDANVAWIPKVFSGA